MIQIYIGGDNEGEQMLADHPTSPKDPNWLLNPGAVIKPVCGKGFDAIDFVGMLFYFYHVN
jgi:hypothetical protein